MSRTKELFFVPLSVISWILLSFSAACQGARDYYISRLWR